MDLKIDREMLPVTEVILDEMQEQSVELDYVLPDYDPDIFRMIGCEIQPTIVTSTTGTDRITYELRADIRVLYCGSGSTLLQCVGSQPTAAGSAWRCFCCSPRHRRPSAGGHPGCFRDARTAAESPCGIRRTKTPCRQAHPAQRGCGTRCIQAAHSQHCPQQRPAGTPGSRRTVQTAWNRCSSPCRTARS